MIFLVHYDLLIKENIISHLKGISVKKILNTKSSGQCKDAILKAIFGPGSQLCTPLFVKCDIMYTYSLLPCELLSFFPILKLENIHRSREGH